MKLGSLRWALAVGLSVGLAAAAKLAWPDLKDAESSAFTLALFGAGIALAIALLRPWWLIESGVRVFARLLWIAHLRRRAGDTTVLLRGPLRLAWPLRDALFRAHGWLAGFALGLAIAVTAQSSLTQWLFGSRFEGAAMLLGPLLGVLAGAFVALALDRVPRLAAAWRLDGQVDAQASARILEHGAGALLLLFVACTLYWTADYALLVLPLITLAALVGYALPWLLWREKAEHKRGLWLVVLDPDGDGARRGALTLRLVDALAQRWRDGPVTVVLDAALDVGGEQLHAALTLGRERAMFPRIVVELADWSRLLPPPQRWLASPLRELHLPAPLMLPALERFAGEGDQIVLVSGSVEPLAAWRERFRHADCLVAWHGDPAAAAGSTVAGFRAVALDALVSSGLLPSLPDSPSTVPKQPSAVSPVVTEAEAIKAEPAGTGAATGLAQAAMKEQAVVPELPLAPSPQPEPILTATPPAATTSPPTVFVSYLVEYRPMVRQLEQALSALGVRVLYDQLVQPGQDWDLALRQMLESADAVVAVVGQRSAGRRLQLAEIERTQQLAKPLIPVFVDRFDEPAAVKAMMAANIDADGNLKYLADCPDEKDLAELLRVTAQRIVQALQQARHAAPRPEPDTGSAGTSGVPLGLQITLPSPEMLKYVMADATQRSEWTVTFQPALVDPMLARFTDNTEWVNKRIRTLATLLLPPELRTLAARGAPIRLLVDQDSARFPWEAIFSVGGKDVAPASVVRDLRMDGVRRSVPPADQRAALVIANPATGGAGAVAIGQPSYPMPELPGAQREGQDVERILSAAGFAVTQSMGEKALVVMDALYAQDYLCVLIAAHSIHGFEHDGRQLTGVPLSEGVMLSAQAFEQMRQVPELVFLSAERLALIEHQGDREAALRRSMVAALRGLGVRCVVAAGTLLPDDVAGQFSKEFFEAMAARGATVEQAMLSARTATLRTHPKLNTWSAYQVYGDPDYRFPLPSA